MRKQSIHLTLHIRSFEMQHNNKSELWTKINIFPLVLHYLYVYCYMYVYMYIVCICIIVIYMYMCFFMSICHTCEDTCRG